MMCYFVYVEGQQEVQVLALQRGVQVYLVIQGPKTAMGLTRILYSRFRV